MKLVTPLLLLFCLSLQAQYSRDSIHSDFVLYNQRVKFDQYLREQTIKVTFEKPLNSETEDYYREACWAVSQYVLQSPVIEKGLRNLFNGYTTLELSTRRALLEAAYASYPDIFQKEMTRLLQLEKTPRLFAMQTAYLYRIDHGNKRKTALREQLHNQFPGYDTLPVLKELDHYLLTHDSLVHSATPRLDVLFAQQKVTGQKIIYSFQRWNRDYAGLAIIQNADGHFCRDASGRLLVFRQLARSASNLPYFITNGSTPQGIYSIQGTAISHNNLIGPTPNIQLVMPFEADSVYWHHTVDSTKPALDNYLGMLPASWQLYDPMTEAFYAGKVGRTEVIAHGTTIDPDYFKDKPYYPLTPTMGCLCAQENWNMFTGKINSSEQLNLVSTFLSTPGDTGYLMVININDLSQPVSTEEIEQWINAFEHNNKG